MISPPPQRASPPIRVCCVYRRTVNHCVVSTIPAWLIGPVAGRSKSVNARAPVTPAPSSWLRDQSGSAQASPVQARRAKISLLGLLKLLWLTGWRCHSFTEHSTKAEASRFISRFKMTWSILRQHKEKPLSRSSTLPFGPSLYSWLCTPFAACCCWFCFAHCQCRPEALPPSSSHLCFFLLLPHLAAWPETRETWRLARRSPISIAMQSARMQPGNFSTVSL